ncbi:MAG: 3-oxoacyl-ACP reductase FabG [Bacteroidales bacterium]|nr:3-oxoacyl-ACP reductase FabG [Bacteroidales bacterium]
MKLLENKVSVITGGVRGIGLAISVAFAREGARLLLTTTRHPERSAEAIERLRAYGTEVQLVEVDVADQAAVNNVLLPAADAMGGADILVNNAGITRDGLMLRMSEDAWDDVLRVDLKAAYNTIHALLPKMMRKQGAIINIASIVGIEGNAGQCNYAAAKAGLIGLSRSLAKEMGPKGVRTNCIAPGYILTEMTDFMSETMAADYISKIGLRRAGKPEEVANVALFLASDMASYVNGAVIECTGAM